MCLVLIVEDNSTFRQSLKELLRTRFPTMNIEEAADAGVALQKIEELKPDLVFMDIRLPGSSGLELTRKIKLNHAKTVVIVLTSHDLPEYKDAAYRSGANYFFTKGLTTSGEITTLVQSIIATRNLGGKRLANAFNN